MSLVNRLKEAKIYAKNLDDNLEKNPIKELPSENPYAKYAKTLELQKLAIKTKEQTDEELEQLPLPPTYIKPNYGTPKTRFVKSGGRRKHKRNNTTKKRKTRTHSKRNHRNTKTCKK